MKFRRGGGVGRLLYYPAKLVLNSTSRSDAYVQTIVTPKVGGGFRGDRSSKAYLYHKRMRAKRSTIFIIPILKKNNVANKIIENTKLIGIYQIDNDPRGINLDIIYSGLIVGGKLKLNKESSEFGYFAIGKLPKLIAYKHREAIQDWKRTLK